MCILGFQIVVDARPRGRELCAAQRIAIRQGRLKTTRRQVLARDGSCILAAGAALAIHLSL